jgi:hypothetical protein
MVLVLTGVFGAFIEKPFSAYITLTLATAKVARAKTHVFFIVPSPLLSKSGLLLHRIVGRSLDTKRPGNALYPAPTGTPTTFS